MEQEVNTEDKRDPFSEAGAIEAGRLAYNAYGRAVDFKNFQGDPMPQWGSLPEKIRNAWTEAAKAVASRVVMSAIGSLAPPDEHPTSRVQKF